MARPLLDIKGEDIENLAKIGCSNKEIADHYKCSEDTISVRFSENVAKGRAELKIGLRKMQLKSAMNGNVVMMIWLGKQLLGQVDRAQIDITKIDNEVFIEEARRRLGNESDKPRDIETIPSKEPVNKT